jgi:4-hydroxy-4-methyl-2-oxoglutarate aldolase
MSDEIISRLSQLDSCAVSDALDKLNLPGPITGLECLSSNRKIAGKVVTVRLEKAEGRAPGPPRHLCTAAIEIADKGDVLVVEQRTGLDAAGWGGTLSLGAALRGLAGVIVEGPARDIDESRNLDFPVYARSHTARTARGRVAEAETNGTIRVGEVNVSCGDFVIADATAVVFIAHDDVDRVLTAAEAIASREKAMADALKRGQPISEVMGASYEDMLRKERS